VGKLVVLKFGAGNFETGFSVTLQIGEEASRPFSEVTGELPPDPELLCYFNGWQAIYRRLDFSGRPIGLPKATFIATVEECQQAAEQLCDRFNTWLQANSFRPVREKWLEKLLPSDVIRVILQTQDAQLQKLPWHLWDLIERYPKAEIAMSAPSYEGVSRASSSAKAVKILALLGDSTGIDIQADRLLLEQLPDAAVNFLVEPARKDLTNQLWQQNWDILFFAGHSLSQELGGRSQELGGRSQELGGRSQELGGRSQELGGRSQELGSRSQELGSRSQELGGRSQELGGRSQESELTQNSKLKTQNSLTGRLYINPTESLTIAQLKYALRKAVEQGLKLAIFNSCDGLGLARELADLQIPQLIVMREPVPDRIAQDFLKYFLEAYARGTSLYLAVREARERLQGLEDQYPCASWLPVIYQNPAEVPPTWQELIGQSQQEANRSQASTVKEIPKSPVLSRSTVTQRLGLAWILLASAIITVLVMGVRYLGLLQSLELQAFDRLLQLRPDEKPDSRLLVVTITEEDVQAQSQEPRRGSLSDQSLAQLLEKLEAYQPRVIGLDIYRDYPVARDLPTLADRMRHSDRLVAICKVSDPQAGRMGVAPPPEFPSERLGFSDLALDPDSVVRRHLLALTPPPSSSCTASYAFSVQLALRYLATQNIFLQFTPDGVWQLGKLHFRPIEAHTGGYQGIDAWGHQILLNYRSYHSPTEIAPHVTLAQVLANRIDANAVKDRIVLIGTVAESFQDYSLTPYKTNRGATQKIPGVLLQAQMLSQLLSAALDGRPLLWTWSLWQEAFWVLGWSFAGGVLGCSIRRLPYLAIACGVAIVGLYGICLVVLIGWGGWIPLVPAAIALISSTGSVVSYRASLAQQEFLNLHTQE
jgi:CHASE2 domain-containing sensor protein